jgi:type 1 fimbriae regulatory protein FimB
LGVVNDPRDRAIIILGLRHGFRSSEIADLRLSDLDLRNNLIAVRRGKGSERNVHPIEADILNEAAVLKRALDARPVSAANTEYVFISQKGGKLHRSQIFRIFQGYARKVGLPASKQHFHCCKHTLAFQMLEGGAKLNEVQKFLGWKSLATAGHYLSVSDETASMAARCAYVNV